MKIKGVKTQKERHVECDDVASEWWGVVVGDRKPDAHRTDGIVVTTAKSEPPRVLGLVELDIFADRSQVGVGLRLADDGALRSSIEARTLNLLRGRQ